MDDNITQTPEQIADRLQYLGLLPGPQKPFVAYLTANTGLATSLGDLIDKIDDGTVTQNDYIDVLKDLGAISVSTVGLIALAADIEFTFDSRITKIDTSTIPNYTEHPDSSTLPNLRGYGIVSDSYITYNIDENFRTLALEFGSDISICKLHVKRMEVA